MTRFHFKQLLNEVFVMISGNRSRRNMRAFSCAVSGLSTLIAWSLGSTPEVIWLCDRGFKMLPFNGSLRERKWISSYSGARLSFHVTSFCSDFVSLTWYLCFQCLRWRITYRKFTKNSTTKASKQERYDLVFVMLTCCDFT